MDINATKLLVAITQADDADRLADELVAKGFRLTRLKTHGGFLRRENAAALIATTEDRLPAALAIIRQTCRARTVTWVPPFPDGIGGIGPAPMEIEVGGAVVFTIPIEGVELLGGDVAESLARTRAAGGAQ